MATSNALLGTLKPGECEVPLGGTVSVKKIYSAGALYGLPVVAFQGRDAIVSGGQAALWDFVIPFSATLGYSATTGMKLGIWAFAQSAGNVVWGASFQLVGATDLPVPSTELFPAYSGTNEVQATQAYVAAGTPVKLAISNTIANIQNGQTTAPATGDVIRVRVRRCTELATDTLVGPVFFWIGYLQDY